MKLWGFDAPLRWRLIVGATILLVGFGVFQLFSDRIDREKEKPALAVITSLPLLWPEGDFTGALANDSPALSVKQRLERNFEIIPIDNLDHLESRKLRVALLAQPRSFAPAELVALENWIKAGGRALILADPAVQWESSYPIGDSRRPLFTTMLSPLFAHWGIQLTFPMEQLDGQRDVNVQGRRLQLAAYGAWQLSGESDVAECVISADQLLAECKIGNGRALLLADADLLSPDLWQGSGLVGLFGSDSSENMRWLEERLLEMGN
jgi:ABC-type uncharacterized transport system